LNRTFLLRLSLDLVAAGLLVVGLAYYWLDNLSHELIGTAMFALIILHNVFNRRWYGSVSRTRGDAQGGINILTIIILLVTMAALLVTSLMISQSVFGFLPLNGGYTARQIHTLAAYWALVIVSVHVGLRWSMIMGVMQNLFGITAGSHVRTLLLRAAAFAIAAYGIHSASVIGLGAKLTATVTIDYWDFTVATLPFFIHLGSIMGLCGLASHYLATAVRYAKRAARRPIPAPSERSATAHRLPFDVDPGGRAGDRAGDTVAGVKK
jgi:hypothetical protein